MVNEITRSPRHRLDSARPRSIGLRRPAGGRARRQRRLHQSLGAGPGRQTRRADEHLDQRNRTRSPGDHLRHQSQFGGVGRGQHRAARGRRPLRRPDLRRPDRRRSPPTLQRLFGPHRRAVDLGRPSGRDHRSPLRFAPARHHQRHAADPRLRGVAECANRPPRGGAGPARADPRGGAARSLGRRHRVGQLCRAPGGSARRPRALGSADARDRDLQRPRRVAGEGRSGRAQRGSVGVRADERVRNSHRRATDRRVRLRAQSFARRLHADRTRDANPAGVQPRGGAGVFERAGRAAGQERIGADPRIGAPRSGA